MKLNLIGKPHLGLTFDALPNSMAVGKTQRVPVSLDGVIWMLDIRLAYADAETVVGAIANTKHNANITSNAAQEVLAAKASDPIGALLETLPWISQTTAARAIKRAQMGSDGISRWGGFRPGAGRKRHAPTSI